MQKTKTAKKHCFTFLQKITRLHSSRMLVDRFSQHALRRLGACSGGGVCSGGGGCLLPGGGCLPPGGSAARGVFLGGGGIPECTEANSPCEQNS